MHKLPEDFKRAIANFPAAKKTWGDITPLSKNEWICWVTSGKKPETRIVRIKKGIAKLSTGMRRPCCWSGCPHRKKG